MSDSLKKLRVFLLTVGEDSTPDVLKSIKEEINQYYDLTVWYDTCGRPFKPELYDEIKKYTNDIFVLNKNHGTSKALAYALLYLDYDYLMLVLADTILKEKCMDKFLFAFGYFEKLACIGSLRTPSGEVPTIKPDFVVNDKYFMPDGVQVFNRKAVDEIGGIDVNFSGMGMENREWHERAIKNGWAIVSAKNLMTEVGGYHAGRDMNPMADQEIKKSSHVYEEIKRSKDHQWWKREYMV